MTILYCSDKTTDIFLCMSIQFCSFVSLIINEWFPLKILQLPQTRYTFILGTGKAKKNIVEYE